MKIGISYDLRDDYLKMGYSEEETAEFDQAGTIDAIEAELKRQGFETERIGHVKNLAARLVQGDRWDLVFNICEGLFGNGREAQVPALLDAYQVPYVFSGPLVLALTLDKAFTKDVIRAAGIPSPDYHVVYRKEDIEAVRIPFPLFAKPLAEGTGKGIYASSVITAAGRLREVCSYLLDTFRQPVLVEAFLPGREFTAGIVGTTPKAHCVGVMEVILKDNAEKDVYSYVNKEECEERVIYRPATGNIAVECAELALKSWAAIRGEDGGRVDIRLDSRGVPNFIEVNPLAGLHPDHSDLPILSRLNGVSYQQLMEMIMRSALEKVNHQP